MLKQILFTLTLFFAASPLLADPPGAPKTYWQNANYNSHYILYDYATRTYIETVNCKALWSFKLQSSAMNEITLYDASRDMTVKLNYQGMYLKAKGQTAFTLYQNGSFDTRRQFSHTNPNGSHSGTLTKQHACGWVEYLAGSHSANWRFQEVGRNGGFVDLYDGSRNMLVRLESARMLLRTGSAPLTFFRNGSWN